MCRVIWKGPHGLGHIKWWNIIRHQSLSINFEMNQTNTRNSLEFHWKAIGRMYLVTQRVTENTELTSKDQHITLHKNVLNTYLRIFIYIIRRYFLLHKTKKHDHDYAVLILFPFAWFALIVYRCGKCYSLLVSISFASLVFILTWLLSLFICPASDCRYSASGMAQDDAMLWVPQTSTRNWSGCSGDWLDSVDVVYVLAEHE